MSLSAGQRLGPYEIAGFIGAGGMGEVYSAVDKRLNRVVAVKILRNDLGENGLRRNRFNLEGRAISSLSHPHICSLYDVGEEAGTSYLVMERLEGETVRKRLKRGPIAVREALEIAIQAGEALDHAHSRGLLHRDLKPENIMLTGQKCATVKLLDFGLAKVMPRAAAAGAGICGDDSDTLPLTAEGAIVGTFQYLSPELLDGREATVRSDIFAYGAVLYEMITGRKSFHGSSRAALIAAILKDHPPRMSVLQPNSPTALDWIVDKALAKDPEDRWQSARDMVDSLKWVAGSGMAAAGTVPAGRRRWFALWPAALALAAGALAGAAFVRSANHTPPVVIPETRFEIQLPDKATLGEFDFPVLSPDGSYIVFPAESGDRSELLIRRLDGLDVRALPGTEGAAYPFWSPDSRWVGFFADGKLKKVDIMGTPPVTLADAPGGIGGTWNRDGVIVFCPKLDSALERVNDSGAALAAATRLDALNHQTSQFFPEFLPDGRHFILYGVSAGRERDFNAAYLGSLDSLEVRALFRTMGRVMFAEPGYLVFASADRLMAQAFDTERFVLLGQPTMIAQGVSNLGAVLGSAFTVRNTSLAYRAGANAVPVATWVNRKGEKLGVISDPGEYGNYALSPDGKLVAADYQQSKAQPRSLWLLDLGRRTRSRLTFDSDDEFNPSWSPDGKRIAFTSSRNGVRNLYEKSADGTGPEQVIFESTQEKNLEDWSPDGNYLLFNTRVTGQPLEIWALPLSGDRKPFRAASGKDNCEQGQFSPDGKWVAYRSYETGTPQVFVQEFPPLGGKWQISNGEGSDPQWRRDGKELFYMNSGKLMAVDIKTRGRQFEAGVPHQLFEVKPWRSGRNAYAVTADGEKFLINIARAEKSAAAFVVVTNWSSRLKR